MTISAAPPRRADIAAPPRRAEGLELLGESRGSGYVESTYLVRRPDGQVVQLSQLLYRTLEHLDGRSADDVAAAVSARVGRELTVEGVEFVVGQKLAPLGLAAPPPGAAAGVAPVGGSAEPVLSLAGRRTLLRPPAVDRLARSMRPLLWPGTVVLVLEAVVLADYLTFSRTDVAAGVSSVIARPAQLLVVLGLMVASMLFHEVGHAAGARYGGARPGVIGMGLYVVWPAFFTDVTDAYRLGRAGRLRTDLGGVYFNLVFLLGLLGAHAGTGEPVLLVAAVLTHLEILQQLLPVVRLDGYFIVGDLVGVPDLFRWMRPILRSLVPGRPADPQVHRLRSWVRWVVTGWVALVVPVLAVNVWVLVTTGPHLVATTAGALRTASRQLSAGLHAGDVVGATVTALSMLALVLPLLGLWVLATRVGGNLRRRVSAFAAHGRRHRVGVALGLGAAVLSVAYAWLPEPVEGPVGPATAAVTSVPTPTAGIASVPTPTAAEAGAPADEPVPWLTTPPPVPRGKPARGPAAPPSSRSTP